MPSLLDEYPMPGMEMDPRELEKAKYLALMRMGLGMAGREPIGAAAGHGLATYATMEENARRNADQKIQELRAKMAYAQSEDKRVKAKAFLSSITPEQRRKFGIDDSVWAAIQAEDDPGKAYLARKETDPFTLDNTRFAGGGPVAQVPKDGIMNYFGSDGSVIGQYPVAGSIVSKAALEGATAAAKATNTPQQIGVDGNGRPLFGYPPPPPSANTRMNFSGPTGKQGEAIARQDYLLNQPENSPGALPPGVISRGPDPTAEALKKEFGTKSVADWFAVGKDSQDSASLAAHIKAKMGVMRDVLSQPDRPEGLLGPFMVGVQQLGASVGIPTEGLSASELFSSVTTQVALTVRNPAGDMGLPGAASNQDFTRLIAVSPNLSQSARGQKLLVESFDAMSEMALKKAELWADLNVRIEGGELTPAKARQEYTKAITPYAMEATKTIRAAIKESETLSKSGAARTGATAAPSTQRAVEMNQLNQREAEVQRKLKEARGY